MYFTVKRVHIDSVHKFIFLSFFQLQNYETPVRFSKLCFPGHVVLGESLSLPDSRFTENLR